MKKECEVSDCPKPVKGYGICENHLKRWKRGTFDVTGLSMVPRKATSEQMIWDKYVDKSGDCWLWQGAVRLDGYGVIRIKGVLLAAHRWAYEQTFGEIPEGMDLDHKCHNDDMSCFGGVDCIHRPCVNPHHLFPRSRKQNLNAGNGAGGKKWKALQGMAGT